jgi:KDO2-lipid IV(A) lauroyltransferase
VKGLLDFFGYYSLRGLSGFLNLLPASAAFALGGFFGFCVSFVSNRKKVVYADLKAALGGQMTEKECCRIARRHFTHLGQMAVEILRVPSFSREDIRKNFRLFNMALYEKAVQDGEGAILITAHFGNWELLQIVSGVLGKPIHVLGRTQKLSRINGYLNRLRETHGSVSVSRGMGLRGLFRALKCKEFIGILGDQDDGKHGGMILPLLGRKTTVPTGAFELSHRMKVPILPAFIVRDDAEKHSVTIGSPIRIWEDCEDSPAAVERGVKEYVSLLESYIRRFPTQWLWGAKRWKYSWTKRILILSDGKAGHVKQSEAVADCFQNIKTQYGRPGMEYPVSKINVCFRSEWHRRVFYFFAFFFSPFVQGRLRLLKFFFAPETATAIEQSTADFIVSAGSSLVPLNLCLARDSRAKSIVLMSPGFPYNLRRYDLVIVPAHDRGMISPKALRTILTPSRSDLSSLQAAGERLAARLKAPSKIKFGVFLGGATRRFRMDQSKVESFFSVLSALARREGDYLVTTSRRTPFAVVQHLKNTLPRDPHCQLLVDAGEVNPPETVPGMMHFGNVLMVSEDSISMISEAVSSGKKVLVVCLGTGLSKKHRRFIDLLAMKSAIVIAEPNNLESAIRTLKDSDSPGLVREEAAALQSRLQEIL